MARKFQYTPPGRDVVAAFERARLSALSNPFTYESELVDTGEGWDFRQNPHFAPSHARKVMLTARMLNNQGIDMSRALRLAHMKHNPRASKKGRVLHKREGGRTAPLTGLIRMPTVAEETWYTEFEDLIPSLDEQYRSGVQPEHMPRDYAGRKLPAIYDNRGRKGNPKSGYFMTVQTRRRSSDETDMLPGHLDEDLYSTVVKAGSKKAAARAARREVGQAVGPAFGSKLPGAKESRRGMKQFSGRGRGRS